MENQEKFYANLDYDKAIDKLEKEQIEAMKEFQAAMGGMMNTVLTNFLKVVCPILENYIKENCDTKGEILPNLYDYVADAINNQTAGKE